MIPECIPPFLLAGALLAGATLAALAHLSFAFTGEAGERRLAEKYPWAQRFLGSDHRLWPRLRHLSALLRIALAAAALLAAARGFDLLWPHSPRRLVGSVLVTAIVAAPLALDILPRTIAEGFADRISAALLPLVGLAARPVTFLLWPLIRIEAALERRLQRRSDEDDRPSAEEEIRSLVNASGPDLEPGERELIHSALSFADTVAREIMTPRVRVTALEDDLTVTDAIEAVREEPHSRFPVYRRTIDDVAGFVHVKDLLRALHGGRSGDALGGMVNRVPFVPETMPIPGLLNLLKAEQAHLAVVVDEYGGTAGIVTMEDIVEELLGEIQDEYDAEQVPLHRLSDGTTVLDARFLVADANEMLGLAIPEGEDYDSLGGYIVQQLGHIPGPGESVRLPDCELVVQSGNERRIQTVRIIRPEPVGQEEGGRRKAENLKRET